MMLDILTLAPDFKNSSEIETFLNSVAHNFTRDPPTLLRQNYGPVEAFAWALCILDQKIRHRKENSVV